jgi:RNA polymerase sigma factor (sigma-70 family)
MLGAADAAADAVEDTFVVAAARLGGLREPRKLRPWLYAVARNECYRRLRAAEEAGLDEAAGTADPSAEAGASAEQAELRRLVRAALDGLNPGEREVIELGLRHDLQGADLAAVLGVPRNQAHALASRARGQLEKALGALLVARTGRRACPELDVLLDGWDGRLTGPLRKRVSRHIDQCDACTDRRRGTLRPAALYGMAPLAALPRGLRAEVLELCADVSPLSQSYRRDVAQSAGPFRPSGFPESARPPRPRMLALAGIAAAAGVVIAIAATGIITVLALSGSHPPGAAAARSGSPSGTSGASVTTSAGSAGGAAPSLSPAASAPAVTSAPPPVAAPSASPIEAKPSPSATSSRPVSPTPAPSRATPTPTPPSTATATPTSTATATATPTSTFTFPG